MTTAYTSLLGLALPVTGELSGTWGDTVNNAITSLLDTAVAGTTSITTDADITLTTTTGASNQARQAIILWNPASGTTTRNITAPAQSKIYTVINASGGTQSIVIRGVGPTTGVTIVKGESATVAWNGTDFVKVSTSGGPGTFTNLTVTGNTILGDASADTLTVNATITSNLIFTDNTYDIGASGATRPRTGYFGTSLFTPLLDATNVEVTNIKALDGTSAASIANSTGVISFVANPILSGGTASGVLYLNGSKVVTSGSAFTFDGSTVVVNAGATAQVAEFRSSAANGVYMSFVNTSTAIGDIGSGANLYSGGSASDFGLNSRPGSSLIFSSANTYRGRFDTSGNLLVNLSTALANGKLQVAGSIGLSGNTEIRQATNSDGNTLRLLATQVVAGSTNAQSYGYAGSGLLAAVSSSASATLLEVGGVTAGHRFTVTNDSTGVSGNLNYTNTGGSRFYVNSLTGYAGFGTSSPVDQVSITTVDGGNTYAKLRLTGSNAGGQINFYNTTYPTGRFNFDQSGNFGIYQSLGYATASIYETLSIDTSQQLYMKAETTGFTTIKALRASAFGYSQSSYGALIIGATSGNITPCFNVDPVANTGGSFSGTGGEVMFRNGVGFIQPNTANTNFNPILTFDTAGNGFYVTKSIGVGGTSPTSSGVGITFPATQSASSNANTLDDYEEGTFTPVLKLGTTTQSLSGSTKANYTKIGNIVYVTAEVYFTKSGTGDFNVSGLPFTSAAIRQSGLTFYFQFYTSSMPSNYFLTYIESSGSNFTPQYMPTSGTQTASVNDTMFTGSTNYFYFAGTYQVA